MILQEFDVFFKKKMFFKNEQKTNKLNFLTIERNKKTNKMNIFLINLCLLIIQTKAFDYFDTSETDEMDNKFYIFGLSGDVFI